MEDEMRFDHFQNIIANILGKFEEENFQITDDVLLKDLSPLALAYIGDAYFSLYVRQKLLAYEQNKVRVLHSLGAKIVSAKMQFKALKLIEDELTEEENEIVRRGRNTKSTVPKSASIHEYRYSTGFESLVGYLYIKKNEERLSYICKKSFEIILKELAEEKK
ncbi:ribonuclease III [Selenomonadales bacterium OttesenSCG-928-I06]|nr:ribonuclease III [Selenomonadales bacterium OttesenSCG-928-I06]